MQPSQDVRDQLWDRAGDEPYAEPRAAHDLTARIRLIAGGDRAGKSRSAAMELAGPVRRSTRMSGAPRH